MLVQHKGTHSVCRHKWPFKVTDGLAKGSEDEARDGREETI